MNKKDKVIGMGMIATILASCSVYPNVHNDGSIGHGIPDNPKKIIPKGCKEYTYMGITVIATSKKNAIKKINKKLDKRRSHS